MLKEPMLTGLALSGVYALLLFVVLLLVSPSRDVLITHAMALFTLVLIIDAPKAQLWLHVLALYGLVMWAFILFVALPAWGWTRVRRRRAALKAPPPKTPTDAC